MSELSKTPGSKTSDINLFSHLLEVLYGKSTAPLQSTLKNQIQGRLYL